MFYFFNHLWSFAKLTNSLFTQEVKMSRFIVGKRNNSYTVNIHELFAPRRH